VILWRWWADVGVGSLGSLRTRKLAQSTALTTRKVPNESQAQCSCHCI
jgi:hypothetical protein